MGIAVIQGIRNVRPPEPLVAILLLVLVVECPALLVVGVYQLLSGRRSVVAAWLYVILGMVCFLLTALAMLA
jgi:hypothetical protein